MSQAAVHMQLLSTQCVWVGVGVGAKRFGRVCFEPALSVLAHVVCG